MQPALVESVPDERCGRAPQTDRIHAPVPRPGRERQGIRRGYLPELATSAGKGCELFFFQRLRAELRTHLQTTPRVVRFQGLRSCVKQLAGRRRWCPRCQTLSDQIVEYLRECFTSEQANDCNLVVV